MRKLILSFSLAVALAPLAKPANVVPKSIKPGDTIAIISPASCIDSMQVVKAIEMLEGIGFTVKTMPHVFGSYYGSYAADDYARAADVMQAFADPSVKAIMCSRGGYGSTRLLPLLDAEVIRRNPKWLIGYSDITALHAYLNKKANMASIHGPMCGHISKEGLDEQSSKYLIDMLTKGIKHQYTLAPSSLNKPGKAKGKLVGGNFLVANGLAGTPYDVLNPDDGEDVILFIEDVGEKIYAIERFLLRMHLEGSLGKVKGIIIGEFTDYRQDEDYPTMEEMISSHLREWGYYDKADMPILFYFPAGHGDPNYPLPMGTETTLDVSAKKATVSFK